MSLDSEVQGVVEEGIVDCSSLAPEALRRLPLRGGVVLLATMKQRPGQEEVRRGSVTMIRVHTFLLGSLTPLSDSCD